MHHRTIFRDLPQDGPVVYPAIKRVWLSPERWLGTATLSILLSFSSWSYSRSFSNQKNKRTLYCIGHTKKPRPRVDQARIPPKITATKLDWSRVQGKRMKIRRKKRASVQLIENEQKRKACHKLITSSFGIGKLCVVFFLQRCFLLRVVVCGCVFSWRQWKPFGLPPSSSSIPRATRLGGDSVWTVMSLHRAHMQFGHFHDTVKVRSDKHAFM